MISTKGIIPVSQVYPVSFCEKIVPNDIVSIRCCIYDKTTLKKRKIMSKK